MYKLIRFFILKMTADKPHLVIDYLKYNLLPVRNTYQHHLLSKAFELLSQLFMQEFEI